MKLRNKIIVVFLSIVLLALGITSYIFYHRAKNALTNQVMQHLESVANIQENRLQDIVDQTYERLHLITHARQILQNIERDTANLDPTRKQRLTNALHRLKEPFKNFKHLHIATKGGIIIASTDSAEIGKSHAGTAHFEEGLKKPTIDNFFLDEKNELSTYYSAPIYVDEKLVGVLTIESSMGYLIGMLRDYAGLGETGETTLAIRNENGDAVFVNPLRFDPEAPLKRIVPKEKTETPIIQALNKKERVLTEAVDYSGQEVMAATGYVEEMDWGLVTKINRDEALQPIYRLRSLFIIIPLIVAAILIVIVVLFTRTITRPITELTEASHKIMEGDYFQRVKITTKDEVGALARTFNKMADSLEQAREQLRQKIDELENANEELKQFTHIVSHDLKAPLRSISSIAQWIVEDHKESLNEAGLEQLKLLEKKTAFMNALIDDILKFSRAGRIKSILEQIDVSELIDEIVELIQPDKNVIIEKATSLPVIHFEKTPLVQLFQNLISNAIKYNDKEQKIIKIAHEDKGSKWQFSVADNGLGIPENAQEGVFDMFQTLHEKSPDSTGIGLAIVKKIIKNYNGEVWIKSEIGKGSTFFFTLPKTNNN